MILTLSIKESRKNGSHQPECPVVPLTTMATFELDYCQGPQLVVVLPQLVSVLMSVAHQQKPHWCSMSRLQPVDMLVHKAEPPVGPYWSECPVLESGSKLSSESGLLGVMSGSMTLLQPGPVLMSVAPGTIEGHAETMLVTRDHAAARATLMWVVYAATRAMLASRHKLLPRAISGSMILLQLGLVWIFTACVTAGVHKKKILTEMWGMCWASLPFTGLGIAGPGPHWTLQEESWSYPSLES